jgi:hypothetical protein
LAKELRVVIQAVLAADRHAKEYDRIRDEIRHIGKPLNLPECASGFGNEDRLVHQALSATRLQSWGFSEIPERDSAAIARAIGNAPDRRVTLEQVISDGIERIRQMIAALTGQGK